ncbi:MAG: transcriptional repressor LexA [Planctomycetota bacterium]
MAYTPPGRTREKVFRFVRDRLLSGSPPTVREVQVAMGFEAVESARRHLDALVAEGRLHKTPGRSRSYRLAETRSRQPRVRTVPLLGRVQAGTPHAAIEAPDGYVSAEIDSRGEFFALRVRGDSMIDLGILENDLVIVHRQDKAEHGDIVVAMVGDEATVKTLLRRGRRAELAPANPRYAPLAIDPETTRILGKVVEVRRRLT